MAQETVDSDIGDRRRHVLNTTERPYSGIAHLKHENGNAIGTGFLVKYGDRIFLVTAAHCLWDEEKKAFRAKIDISLGRNGEDDPFGTITKKAVDFKVPREYTDEETRGRKYDYGIIRLDKKEHKLDECCAFDLEPRTDLYMSGYPGIPKEQKERKDGVPGWPPGTQWEIKLTTVTVNERSLHYQDATTPGNSGSPVYEIKDGRYVAHGIHTNGIGENHTSNSAVRIDVDALMDLVKTTSHGTRPQDSPPQQDGKVPNDNHSEPARPQDSPPQQDGKVPNDNHSEPARLSWFQYLWNIVTSLGQSVASMWKSRFAWFTG